MIPLLLPQNPLRRSIIDQLNTSLNQAQALYASVCFWSIGPGVLTDRLQELLAKPGSFCIVDIHPPTNVDKIDQFYQSGASSFFLFFKEIQPKKLDALHLQRHLLHTKMLLIDLPNGQAELWVGSHNFTKYALKGVNREASLVIPCHQNDMLYRQAMSYLHSILQDPDCRPFNRSLLETYKELQGQPKEQVELGPYFLPLAWSATEMTTLANQLILLAGTDPQEHMQFKRIDSDGTQLAIRAYDLSGGPTRYFSAVIRGQGGIDLDDPGSYDIEFGERHLAVRNGTQLPFVAPLEEIHSRDTLRRFGYYVSIRILDELPSNLEFADDMPLPEAKWQADPETNDLLKEVNRQEVLEVRSNYPTEVDAQTENIQSFYGSEYESFESEQEAQRVARVTRWLNRARQRRARSVPPEPKALHAVFNRISRHLPESFATLDKLFQVKNLPALRANFEQPLRQAFYSSEPSSLNTLDTTQGPQVRKLLKRYRLR